MTDLHTPTEQLSIEALKIPGEEYMKFREGLHFRAVVHPTALVFRDTTPETVVSVGALLRYGIAAQSHELRTEVSVREISVVVDGEDVTMVGFAADGRYISQEQLNTVRSTSLSLANAALAGLPLDPPIRIPEDTL